MVCLDAQAPFEEAFDRYFWNLFCLFYFFLLKFDRFSLKRPKSEEYSFFRGGLVRENTVSPPSIFPGAAPSQNTLIMSTDLIPLIALTKLAKKTYTSSSDGARNLSLLITYNKSFCSCLEYRPDQQTRILFKVLHFLVRLLFE